MAGRTPPHYVTSFPPIPNFSWAQIAGSPAPPRAPGAAAAASPAASAAFPGAGAAFPSAGASAAAALAASVGAGAGATTAQRAATALVASGGATDAEDPPGMGFQDQRPGTPARRRCRPLSALLAPRSILFLLGAGGGSLPPAATTRAAAVAVALLAGAGLGAAPVGAAAAPRPVGLHPTSAAASLDPASAVAAWAAIHGRPPRFTSTSSAPLSSDAAALLPRAMVPAAPHMRPLAAVPRGAAPPPPPAYSFSTTANPAPAAPTAGL